jgi:hypothetical protein
LARQQGLRVPELAPKSAEELEREAFAKWLSLAMKRLSRLEYKAHHAKQAAELLLQFDHDCELAWEILRKFYLWAPVLRAFWFYADHNLGRARLYRDWKRCRDRLERMRA